MSDAYGANPWPLPIGAMPGAYREPPLLSRRDIFALESLRAIAANGADGSDGELAERAVRLADKMLAKLDKPKG